MNRILYAGDCLDMRDCSMTRAPAVLMAAWMAC